MIGLLLVATTVYVVWSLSLSAGLLCQLIWRIREGDKLELVWRGLARIHQELWLFVPPGILIAAAGHWHSDTLKWATFFDAVAMWNWWNYRNWPEDNHWKRRGKRAKEAVERRAGRLVVVPVAGGAS